MSDQSVIEPDFILTNGKPGHGKRRRHDAAQTPVEQEKPKEKLFLTHQGFGKTPRLTVICKNDHQKLEVLDALRVDPWDVTHLTAGLGPVLVVNTSNIHCLEQQFDVQFVESTLEGHRQYDALKKAAKLSDESMVDKVTQNGRAPESYRRG